MVVLPGSSSKDATPGVWGASDELPADAATSSNVASAGVDGTRVMVLFERTAAFVLNDVPSLPAKRKFIWRVKNATKIVNVVFIRK